MATADTSKPRNTIAEWAVTLLVLLFGTSTIAQPFVIPTSSMHDTLLTGDHVIVDKLAYSPTDPVSKRFLPYEDVKRGDIVVFRHPTLLNENYVKRVIGVPGDRIKLRHRVAYLNGNALSEPYVVHTIGDSRPYRDNFPGSAPEYASDASMAARASEMLRDHVISGELLVPDRSYFVMGDNRDNSLDSRYWGLVPRENIVGKPVMVFWSYDASTEDLRDYNVHHVLDLGLHFFSKTRWNRTFLFVRGYPLN